MAQHSNAPVRLSFHGAASTVTGSKHLLEAHDTKILLDAGLFQGRKSLRERNWQPPGFDPSSVDQVVVSHTHIDHVGYLPRLVAQGLDAPVHMTRAAYDLAKLMLLDSAKLQQEDARRANRKGYSKHKPAEPLYTIEDAWNALDLRHAESYGQWFSLHPKNKVRARLHQAGHILGAAFVELAIDRDGSDEPPLRVVFSGDIGRYDIPLHRDPEPLPACDVLIVESTYGDRLHTTESVIDQLRGPLRKCLSSGGTVLIPAFAVGRSQLISLVLRRLMLSGEIPRVPIHIDSPMAVHATEIYDRYLDEKNLDDDLFADGRESLLPTEVHFHESTAESKRLNTLDGPRIVVSASGMLVGGRVLHHLKRLARDPKNLVLLAGYQPPGTRGRALADGEQQIKIHGQRIPVRCQVLQLAGLSGHADRDELLRWVATAPEPPRACFVVHGEPEPAAAFAEALGERFGAVTHVPELDQAFDLGEVLSGAPQRVEPSEVASAALPATSGTPSVQTARGRRSAPPVAPARRAEPLPEATAPVPPGDTDARELMQAIVDHPTYLRAERDLEFLDREELRSVRFQLEYEKCDLLLRDRGVRATLAVFGGSRIREPEVARQRLELAEAALAALPESTPADAALSRDRAALEVERARRLLSSSRYYEEARELGRIVGRSGGGPSDPRLLVCTGGGPGIMEAANRGAHDVGAPSIGLNITLPHEQFPNPYITPELAFHFRYFAIRKIHFLLRARALVAFPGGYGTLDELFETLCLIQTRKIEPLPVVLVGEAFWRGTFDVDHLIQEGTIDPEDADLFWYAETGQQVWDTLRAWYQRQGRSIFDPADRVAEEEQAGTLRQRSAGG